MSTALALVRPVNCLIGAVGTLIGALVAVGFDILDDPVFLGMALLVVALHMAAGNMLNDYFDRETDKVAHPDRPIPSGKVRAESVRNASIAIFALSVALSWFINPLSFLIALLAALLMMKYEVWLKARGFVGNLSIAALIGLVFVFGGAAVGKPLVPLFLGILAGLANISREIVKDVEDMEGDKDRRTLPKQIGERKALAVAAIVLIIAVAMSPLAYWPMDLLSVEYVYVVAGADLVFIASITRFGSNPRQAQNLLKLGMVVSLASFLAGARL